ncbi:hypothetical protein M0812_26656 [Anaeramoeba flamelloides]|uniref:Uncharacterized protein n=1 Tax=Anaeramoeba flamelloides TaxID=1746091 RepID=A0AAV7YB95_9EUKA|nr:hypothetical protein M0812_26656 [Anaeramoeba flamelloides]
MNTITEKYIPIIKITKNLMEVIFKKFNVSYDGKFHERRRKIQELCTHPKWNQVYDELVKEGLWDPNYVQRRKKKEQKNCDKSPNTDWIPFSNGEHEFEENFILRIIKKRKKKKNEKREKEKEGEKEKEIEIEIEIEEESEKTKKTKKQKT